VRVYDPVGTIPDPDREAAFLNSVTAPYPDRVVYWGARVRLKAGLPGIC
jgi:hypothetical protein